LRAGARNGSQLAVSKLAKISLAGYAAGDATGEADVGETTEFLAFDAAAWTM
jgi:hypothetical protein